MGSRSYCNAEFKQLVKDGKHTPFDLPMTFHAHYILVNGRPRWVSSLRKSDACETIRCKVITTKLVSTIIKVEGHSTFPGYLAKL